MARVDGEIRVVREYCLFWTRRCEASQAQQVYGSELNRMQREEAERMRDTERERDLDMRIPGVVVYRAVCRGR